MKIALVNPPVTVEEEFGRMAGVGAVRPPLNLLSLATFVKRAGHQPLIIDCLALRLGFTDVVHTIRDYDPPLVGITSTTLTINKAGRLAHELRRGGYRGLIVFGGVHLTALPEDTMKRFPEVDIGVLGEGELTLLDLIETIEQRKSLQNVRGIIFRQGQETIYTEARELIDQLDGLPPSEWDLLPSLVDYYQPTLIRSSSSPSAYIQTSRGCPYHCTFCSRSVFGSRVRLFSIEYVVSVIRGLISDYGVRDITIYDETFLISRKRILDFCASLARNKLPITWSCNSRARPIDQEILQEMYRAGCRSISFGLESGSQRILDDLKKGIRVEEAYLMLERCKRSGITTSGFFILGTPTETEETLRETEKFIMQAALDYMTPFYFNPLPGSEMYETSKKIGTYMEDWDVLNTSAPIYEPPGVSLQTVERYYDRIMRRFYMKPRVIKRIVTNSLNRHTLPVLLKGGATIVRRVWARKGSSA